MKLTVSKYLNVRVGQPSVNAPCYQYLAPGTELDVDGELYDGDEYDGDNQWYKDEANNYYWKGGFVVVSKKSTDSSKLDFFTTGSNSEPIVDYRKQFGLGADFMNDDCSRICVAMIDTGVDFGHLKLKSNLFKEVCLIGSNPIDKHGHGTHLAGIISSKTEGGQLVGIAPSCKIFSCKISDDGRLNKEILVKGLEEIDKNKGDIDILNLSLSVPLNLGVKEDKIFFNQDLSPLLKKIYDSGVIICGAAGNDDYLKYQDILMPAYSQYIISVGTVESQSLDVYRSNGFHPRLDYYFLNQELKSSLSQINKIEPAKEFGLQGNTSVFTAVLSGLAAAFINKSNFTKKERRQKFLEFLDGHSTTISKSENFNNFKIYKA